MSDFLYNMGLQKDWGVVDVIGFDAELLQFLPQPVGAVILLYPVSKVQSSGDGIEPVPEGVYFMKQTIGNACGTIALLHSVANCLDLLSLAPDSSLSKFFAKTAVMNPEERGRELESSSQIAETHASSAHAGQTAAPDLAAEIDYHFVAFVHKNGKLYEMDGRKQGTNRTRRNDCGHILIRCSRKVQNNDAIESGMFELHSCRSLQTRIVAAHLSYLLSRRG